MFHHYGEWPVSMQRAIERSGLPLKKRKVFSFLRKIGVLDQDNTPDQELMVIGYFVCDYERYNRRSANLPRIASSAGLTWFINLMKENLSEVS